MSKVTIVSALFDIERVDGRPWEEYLKWFEEFLKLKTPMILFVSEDVAEFIGEKRNDIPTEIVVQNVDQIPYYDLKDQIQEILDTDEYKENISDAGRIECKQAMYSVIQYSKFPWLKQAAKDNPDPIHLHQISQDKTLYSSVQENSLPSHLLILVRLY